MSDSASERRPVLPLPLRLPLTALPKGLHSLAAARLLDRLFATEIREGELDFLRGRRVRIMVEDADIAVHLGLDGSRFTALPSSAPVDLSIRGRLYDYLLLIGGREDPDTLFFQRRLAMEGDTDLGVHLKNFLASVEMPLPPFFDQGLALYERLGRSAPISPGGRVRGTDPFNGPSH